MSTWKTLTKSGVRVRTFYVLVVDDDESFSASVTDFLEGEGLRARSASDGLRALEVIQQERPDLILLDMYMPVMDGWKLVREMRSRRIDVPIIAMTSADEVRRDAQEIRAAAYIAKPMSLPLLIQRLDRILGPQAP